LVWKINEARYIYFKTKTKLNYDIFAKLGLQYKTQSKLVFNEFIHHSVCSIGDNSKYFWKWVSYNTCSQSIPNSLHLGNKIANNGEDISNLFLKYFSSV